MNLESPFRFALLKDATHLISLANSTVEGFAQHLWEDLDGEGETALQFGLRVQQGFIEKKQAIVAEIDEKIASLLVSYKIGMEPKSFMPGVNAGLNAQLALHALVPGSWYIHALAVAQDHRGLGLGSRMIGLSEKFAGAEKCTQCSLLVLNKNANAIKLYEHLGYKVIASSPVVKNGWQNSATDWLLMTKNLS